jgi:hypothetical protein
MSSSVESKLAAARSKFEDSVVRLLRAKREYAGLSCELTRMWDEIQAMEKKHQATTDEFELALMESDADSRNLCSEVSGFVNKSRA